MHQIDRLKRFQCDESYDGTTSQRFWWRIAALVLAIGFWAPYNAWALKVSPATMTFQTVEGVTTSPASQTVVISKANNRQRVWAATDNTSWLTVSPAGGLITNASQISVRANTTGLAAGTYSGKVTIRLDNGATASLRVNLKVAAPSTSTSSTPTKTSANLTWSPNTDPDIAGYNVYMGLASGVYGPPIRVGNVTSYVVNNLSVGSTYYFAVSAYDTHDNESLRSAEVSKSSY